MHRIAGDFRFSFRVVNGGCRRIGWRNRRRLCDNNHIGLPDLPSNIGNFASEKKLSQPSLSNKDLDFHAALRNFEERLIDEALRLADGNKAMAARMLKLKRTTLVAKLRNRTPRKEEDERPWSLVTP